MAAAIEAGEAGAQVVLLEHNDRLGKKINASGNGRCNLSNSFLDTQCYRGGDHKFVDKVLAKCSPQTVREWFNNRGLFLKEKKGYFYPRSEQAASVVSFFASRLVKAGVTVRCSAEVQKVRRVKGCFEVTYMDLLKDSLEILTCDKVILASGGLAGQNLGAGPIGYETAKAFGHVITPLFPALVQMVAKDKNLKMLSGVRSEAGVHLITSFDGIESYYDESGEVLFTDYGISGIAVMQLSRYAGDVLRQGGAAKLSIDFCPEFTFPELLDVLENRIYENPELTLEDCFCTLLSKKLFYVILVRAGVAADIRCKNLSKDLIKKICRGIKEFRLPIIQTKDFAMAQVTAGGVALSGVSASTLESKVRKGLYITGELLDVDGTCGGYNLQFAFATGILAGKAAAGRTE